jgi:hypothetical protein
MKDALLAKRDPKTLEITALAKIFVNIVTQKSNFALTNRSIKFALQTVKFSTKSVSLKL